MHPAWQVGFSLLQCPQPEEGSQADAAASRRVFLSVVIPCYNESQRILATLDKAAAFLASQDYAAELVIVDDGSRDGTPEVVARFAEASPVLLRLLAQPENRGKGHAVRVGALAAEGDFLLITDADLPTPIEQVERLLEPLRQGLADIAVGSRNLPSSEVERPLIRTILSHGFNLCVRMAGIHGLRDTQCPFKLLPRAAAQEIFPLQRLEGWGFDVEILRIAQLRGYRIVEAPVTWVYATGSKLKLARDAVRMLRELLRVRLNEWRGLYSRAGGTRADAGAGRAGRPKP